MTSHKVGEGVGLPSGNPIINPKEKREKLAIQCQQQLDINVYKKIKIKLSQHEIILTKCS